VPVPALARWLLGLGIAATLAANVAHGLGHGPVGAAVAAWPAVALVGSYELSHAADPVHCRGLSAASVRSVLALAAAIIGTSVIHDGISAPSRQRAADRGRRHHAAGGARVGRGQSG